MEVNQIGFFQFDNLIQNRVPFILVNLGVDLSSWYKAHLALHLENHTLACTPENAIELVQAKKVPPHYALVVIDAKGETSFLVAASLEAAGFINVYVVKNGLAGLAIDRAAQ